jgi:predicted lipoprotein
MPTDTAKEQREPMTNTTQSRRVSLPRLVGALALAALVAVAALSVKVVGIEESVAFAPVTFDPAAYAQDRFESEIAPQIEAEAHDLATLVTALDGGADPAEYGHTSGANSAYAFPVTFTAVAGEVTEPTLILTVDGVPSDIVVQMQVGPALNGTALRDVTGTISFNQFVNQLEYQAVGTELNNRVRETVLSSLKLDSIAGKTLRITGAYLRVNPKLISVVPVRVEVLP